MYFFYIEFIPYGGPWFQKKVKKICGVKQEDAVLECLEEFEGIGHVSHVGTGKGFRELERVGICDQKGKSLKTKGVRAMRDDL